MEPADRVRPDRSRRALIVRRVLPIVVVTIVVVVGAAVLSMAMGHARTSASGPIRDATLIRGIHVAMVVWAQNDKGRYPEPSVIDAAGATIALEPGDNPTTKDTTANIISFMVFNGFMSPEMAVSWRENNPSVRVFDKYAYEKPPTAADPAKALWDPAMRADFTTGVGHISYAHMPLGGPRRGLWSLRVDPSVAIVGERGPEVSAVRVGDDGVIEPTLVNPSSLTYYKHQKSWWQARRPRGWGVQPKGWQGNIAFDDNSVRFVTSITPEGVTYTDDQSVVRPDVLFYDEPTDPKGTNNMLGIWVKAGPRKEDFKAVWD